jgi:predicted aspartyl protease
MKLAILAVAAAGAALAGCATVPAPDDGTPLSVHRNRLFLAASVNGQPVEALLDSGAEMTSIDDDRAASLGLALTGADEVKGSGGTAKVRFSEGVTVEAAGIRLADRMVAVFDLDEVASRLIGRPVPVIVGREVFDAARLRIDVDGGRIASVPRDREPTGARLPLTTHKGIEHFPVSVEGHSPASAAFDLGNGGTVLIGKAYAERLGLTAPNRIVGRRTGGGIGGAIERDLVILQTVTIAGRTFENVEAAIDPLDSASDLNIGTQLLRRFLITADYAQHALWLEPRR